MNNKKKIIIMIFIILIILISVLKSIKYKFLQDDLIFFQIFSSKNNSNSIEKKQNNIEKYNLKEDNTNKMNTDKIQAIFDVKFRNIKFKDINLYHTINEKTLVYEKIAPGIKGDFDIILNSNQKLNYIIKFESKNDKPVNLKFYVKGDDKKYNTLEELSKTLNGVILKNEKRVININWEWTYENNQQGNNQDTMDAKKIREYNFLIYVQGI